MHANENRDTAPNVLDLEEGQFIVIHPDGRREVRACTGVELFILKNDHIPSFFLPSVIDGYRDHPEFYESGEFWSQMMASGVRKQVAEVALSELVATVEHGDLLDAMPNEEIRMVVADLIALYDKHVRAKLEQTED